MIYHLFIVEFLCNREIKLSIKSTGRLADESNESKPCSSKVLQKLFLKIMFYSFF